MARARVLIVPKGEVEKYLEEAERLGIGEILDGVPPRLKGVVDESELPKVYEEEVIDWEEERRRQEDERVRRYRERLGMARSVEEKVAILAEYLGLGMEG